MTDRPYHHFGDRRYPKDYRKEEIGVLRRAISRTENRLLLSMPDVGLSNLIKFLITGPNWGEYQPIFAYLSCNILDDCLKLDSLFVNAARQFHEQGIGHTLDTTVEGYECLHKLLQQVSGDRLSGAPLVFTVNKADRMLVQADASFYRRLKTLADTNNRLCFVFAAGIPSANTVDPFEPLFAGRWQIVGRFNARDLAGAITEEGLRIGREIDPYERDKLTHLTGGHAGLLRAISAAVVELNLDLSEPEEVLVDHLIKRGDVQSRCKRIWDALNLVQQAALQAITTEEPDLGVEDVLVWLKKFDLIEELEGEYRLFSPIFQRFVAIQEILPEATSPECVKIDNSSKIDKCGQEIVVAGNVFKGDQTIDVSPLELRLIACLTREQRVYTKREVALYVYCEDYEEAYEQNQPIPPDPRIDNLVRQVRSKLGDRRYIRTHYKRGYEFIGGCRT